jgi:hypothetical protein
MGLLDRFRGKSLEESSDSETSEASSTDYAGMMTDAKTEAASAQVGTYDHAEIRKYEGQLKPEDGIRGVAETAVAEQAKAAEALIAAVSESDGNAIRERAQAAVIHESQDRLPGYLSRIASSNAEDASEYAIKSAGEDRRHIQETAGAATAATRIVEAMTQSWNKEPAQVGDGGRTVTEGGVTFANRKDAKQDPEGEARLHTVFGGLARVRELTGESEPISSLAATTSDLESSVYSALKAQLEEAPGRGAATTEIPLGLDTAVIVRAYRLETYDQLSYDLTVTSTIPVEKREADAATDKAREARFEEPLIR